MGCISSSLLISSFLCLCSLFTPFTFLKYFISIAPILTIQNRSVYCFINPHFCLFGNLFFFSINPLFNAKYVRFACPILLFNSQSILPSSSNVTPKLYSWSGYWNIRRRNKKLDVFHETPNYYTFLDAHFANQVGIFRRRLKLIFNLLLSFNLLLKMPTWLAKRASRKV
ncbi:hypothetical protein NQ318_019493 [Aromia moschata]|uniref:Uncharacterized protein n=1 Tax=Aromia moschata TaxID=1265417 RepID=A0AAV8X7Y1_9CUCU|nr:hypothetical protein NQ318_019493 [Aromia moschata]